MMGEQLGRQDRLFMSFASTIGFQRITWYVGSTPFSI